jgi:hypothetical protein
MSPERVLVKPPVPAPSVVWLSVVVGDAELDQQTPLAVTEDPPSQLTVPPLAAPVEVMAVRDAVVRLGSVAMVVKLQL